MNKIKRYIGFNDIEEIKNTIIKFKLKSENNNSYVFIDNELPNNINKELLEDLNPVIDNSYNINREILKSILLKYGLSISKYEYVIQIISLYVKNEKNISRDIIVNFTAKMILWLKSYFRSSNINYNIAYIGKIKKHGMYFLVLLHLCGYNITYFTLEDNDEFLRIKDIDTYSVLIKGNKYISENDKKINDLIKEELKNRNLVEYNLGELGDNNTGTKRRLNIERNVKNTNVSNTSENLIEFISEINSEKIDTFYNGFIGCDYDEESYKNLLCELKTTLKKQYKLIEVSHNILPLSNEEINMIISKINYSNGKLDAYVLLFKEYFNDSRAFEVIIDEFSQKTKSKSVIENFSLKLLIWAIRIKDFIKSDTKKVVLYFGNIKLHEIYFIKMLREMQINIVYICASQEFNNEIVDIGHMKIYKGSKFYDITEYPEKSLNEVETTAYRAEQQIDSVLYNDETGMYRPYQLNSKEIISVILRTTLDEAFILWGEEAKFRSGFVNEESHVENPVLFLKIDGVYKDINDYYDLFVKLKNNNNTEVIYETNIYENKYNNQDYYGANYLFDNADNVIVNKLKESKYYKYQYLDKNVQNNLIHKINELIKGRYLLFNKDKDFKIRVLLTVLNLDEKFIKMLQGYDIGGAVPKVVLYNNSRDQYSKEDSIIIMFMVLMGIDVVLFNPAGYLNIENMIDEKIISKFKLEAVEYNFEIPDKIKNKKEKKSFFKRIFNI